MAQLPAADDPGLHSAVFRTGDVLDGKYRYERTLAEGGVGIVVLAHHLQLDRPVAIKYLRPDALQRRVLVEQFEREARLAAKMKSENVVRIHDVGVHPSLGPYMVMELLEGIDLEELLEKGPLAVPEAVAFVLQACSALSEAHALEIVHRDVKPANLFLASRPQGGPILKLIDFGISKVVPRLSAAGAWGSTEPNAGTPHYMSPEQLRGTNIDARSDVWALGVVLHELLTASMPFDGATMDAVCKKILDEPPTSLAIARPDIPPTLDAIVRRCLDKDPAKRFRSVNELADSLAPFGGATASGPMLLSAVAPRVADPKRRAATVVLARRDGAPRRGVLIAVLGGMLALALAGAMLVALALRKPARVVEPLAFPEPPAAVPIAPTSTATEAVTVAAVPPVEPAQPPPSATTTKVVRPRAGTKPAGASDPRAHFGERK